MQRGDALALAQLPQDELAPHHWSMACRSEGNHGASSRSSPSGSRPRAWLAFACRSGLGMGSRRPRQTSPVARWCACLPAAVQGRKDRRRCCGAQPRSLVTYLEGLRSWVRPRAVKRRDRCKGIDARGGTEPGSWWRQKPSPLSLMDFSRTSSYLTHSSGRVQPFLSADRGKWTPRHPDSM